jgi:hypothetical protein
MKLSVNLISHRRYYKVGEDIPAEQVPPAYARYAVADPAEFTPDDLQDTLESPDVRKRKPAPARKSRKWGASG